MSHAGKTQITMMFTADGPQVAEGDRLFTSHGAFMKGHHRDGDKALLAYNVASGPELSNSLDPSSEPTGRTSYVLTEVYESPAGVADHWAHAGEWADFGAFVEWAGAVEVHVLHGSPVVQSLW